MIITDKPTVVPDVSNLGVFRGSDHNSLLWKLDQFKQLHDAVCKQLFDYSKALCRSHKTKIAVNSLHSRNYLCFQCRPPELAGVQKTLQWKRVLFNRRHTKWSEPISMTNKASEAVRHRHRIYRKYKDTSQSALRQLEKNILAEQVRKDFENYVAEKI